MNIDHIDEIDPVDSKSRIRKFLIYTLPMDDFSLCKLALPYDLTRHEADRLMGIIDSLPLSEKQE